MDRQLLSTILKLSGSYYLPSDKFGFNHQDYTIGIDTVGHKATLKENKSYVETRTVQFGNQTIKIHIFKFSKSVNQDDIHPYYNGWGRSKGWYERFHVYKYSVDNVDSWIEQFNLFTNHILSNRIDIPLNDWTRRENYPQSYDLLSVKTAYNIIVIVGGEGIGKTTLAKKFKQFSECPIVSSLDELSVNSCIVENLESVDVDKLNNFTGGVIITTRTPRLLDNVMNKINRSVLTIELVDIPYNIELPIYREYITLP